jgi:2-oxoglutarate ferredoxin oxidoreductase subunit alpha
MSDKRDRKIQGALADLDPPEEYGDPGPLDVGVVAWGSTFGSALDAVQSARDQGLKVGCLKITTLFPYHEDRIQAFMDRSKTILIPELNHSGQLNTLIGHLGRGRIIRLNQSTGIPLYPSTILGKIHELIGEDRS